MGKLSQFIQQQTQLELGAENITVDSEPITPKVIKTLEEVLEGLMVMPPLSQYPVTVYWPEQAESYKGEIDLLEACLNHAPDLAWYCHFLNLAKPYILERSRERKGIKTGLEVKPKPLTPKVNSFEVEQAELLSLSMSGGHYE